MDLVGVEDPALVVSAAGAQKAEVILVVGVGGAPLGRRGR